MFKTFCSVGAVALTSALAMADPVHAQQFQLVDASPLGMSIVDTNSVRRSGDMASVDAHLIYRSPLSFEAAGDSFDVIQRGVMAQEHNCRTGQFRLTSIRFVTFDGKQSGPPGEAGDWEKLNEGSPAFLIHGLLCRNEPASDVDFPSLEVAAHIYYGVVNEENDEE